MLKFRSIFCSGLALVAYFELSQAWALDVKAGLWEIMVEGVPEAHKACLTRELLDPTNTRERRRELQWMLVASVGFGTLPGPVLLGKAAAGAAEMLSTSTAAAVILLGSMLWLRSMHTTVQPQIDRALPRYTPTWKGGSAI